MVGFKEVESWAIAWDRNKAIDIGEWSICGVGRLERFYCIGKCGGSSIAKWRRMCHLVSRVWKVVYL